MQENHVSSLIFPSLESSSDIIGSTRLRQEVFEQIREDPDAYAHYCRLSEDERNALIEFCMGNRGLQITYDPFFREIFHPLKHPTRLSRFLSALLGQSVTVQTILPREGIQLSNESSLMIMDVLVQTSDGTLINVEMQKIGYAFPIERTFCYGSDLLVRQYANLREELKNYFSYVYMRPVYVIVLMEKSPGIFHEKPDSYIHHSNFQFDSGLPTKNLLNFIYIPLDIFLNIPHNELTELDAWLYFLSSSNPLHIQQIIEKYPFFKELYQDIINFRFHPKELIFMYSEALAIADRNTIKYMIDELKQELKETESELSEKNAALYKLDAALAEKDAALSKKDAALSEKDAEIARLTALLAQYNN